MDEWFSIQELMGLPGLPARVSGIRRKAEREGWKCRDRKGRGGGKEYHISSLPPETQDFLKQHNQTSSQREHDEQTCRKSADLSTDQDPEGETHVGDECSDARNDCSTVNDSAVWPSVPDRTDAARPTDPHTKNGSRPGKPEPLPTRAIGASRVTQPTSIYIERESNEDPGTWQPTTQDSADASRIELAETTEQLPGDTGWTSGIRDASQRTGTTALESSRFDPLGLEPIITPYQWGEDAIAQPQDATQKRLTLKQILLIAADYFCETNCIEAITSRCSL